MSKTKKMMAGVLTTALMTSLVACVQLIRQDRLNRKINRATSGNGMKIRKRTTVQILLLRTAVHIITEGATTGLKNS